MARSGIVWLNDLVRLEVVLWERIDHRLKAAHDLPLSFFFALNHVSTAPSGGLRISDLAVALGVTVGGTSKLVDRVVASGFIRRQASPTDRRASCLVLTHTGKRKLSTASRTIEAEMASVLEALTPEEQQLLHDLVTRLLEVGR